MTIEQKAREIAERMAPAGDVWDADVERISLGIIEGLETTLRFRRFFADKIEYLPRVFLSFPRFVVMVDALKSRQSCRF